MDYIIYDENTQIIARANTQQQAIGAGMKWRADWAANGCPNVRQFRVCYNGLRSVEVFDSRNPANLPRAASPMKPTQKEISFPSEPFALMQQTTLDGDELARLAEQRRADREQAEKKQTTMDPEAALRAMYDRMGVSKAKQDEIINDATAKAQPGAWVGPFQIPQTITPKNI